MAINPRGIVIDGSYLLHRTYHALPRTFSRSGKLVNAVQGILKITLGLYNQCTPDAMAIVFDSSEPSFRHKLSPLYKAHRGEYAEELIGQIDLVVPALEAFGFKVVIRPGFEGDDIVGTLGTIMAEEVDPIFIVTGDKDMFQLVNEEVFVLDPFKRMVYQVPEVMAKMKVNPEQIIDYLALVGDRVDGIRGVNGIGGETATRLLREYGDIDTMLKEIDNIKGAVKGHLIAGMENLALDRQLTRIVTDLDLGLSYEDLLVTDGDSQTIAKLCQAYNIYHL